MSARQQSRDALWVLLPTAQRASGEWIDDTLRERMAEQGLTGKATLAGEFPRQRVEVVRGPDAGARVNDLFYRRGWTDGLPIVAPALGRVKQMLRFSDDPAQRILGELEPLKGVATLEKVAVNAVMAGCRPEYLPVVIAAVEAILDPEFNLRGVQTTDENVAPLLVVNGPIAKQLDINAGFGALGPGWQANSSIGRALRLVMHNLGGGWPGAVSFAGLAQPGRYTLCVAENEADSPWPPLHVELGHAPESSTVTITRAETAINVTGGLAEVASVMGSAASNFARIHNGKVAVILAPHVAKNLAADGWSKADVRRHLFEQGRCSADEWRRSWLAENIKTSQWPAWLTAGVAADSVPAVRDPDDITLIVAGADLHIPQHAYFPSWGFPPCRITREIPLPKAWEELLAEDGRSWKSSRDDGH